MVYDTSFLVTVAAAAAAWVAAFFAILSARTAKQSLKLAESQEEKRQPRLVPYHSEAYYKPVSLEKYTIYAFSLSISNPSDIDNAVAYLELQVTYKISEGTKMAVKVPHDPRLSINFSDGDLVHFSVPARIDAHQTIAGWVFFRVDDTLITDFDIDSYTLNITDSHDAMSHLKPIIIREFVDEKEVAKNNP